MNTTPPIPILEKKYFLSYVKPPCTIGYKKTLKLVIYQNEK